MPECRTNDRDASHAQTSGARSPTVSASRSSVVRWACAHVARPVRCTGSGTSRTSTWQSSATRSGRSSSRPGARPCAAASASSTSASGWPRPSSASRRAGRGGGAEAAHQVRALGGVQRGERASAQEPPPARVGRPRRIRWLPTGQYRDGARGQRRQQLAAEPAVERGEQLVGVDEQHRAGVVGHGRDGRRHGGDRPGHVAAVEADHRPAAGHRPPAHLVEQRGLADAARAVDEQHPGGGVAVQGGTERRQLGGPAHEAEPAGVVEGARQGVAHPAIVDMRCRSSGY